MRPFLKKWRGEGIRSSLYLDDGLLASKTYDIACRVALKAWSDLESAGFHINYKKSCWTPSQQRAYLGSLIDTKTMEFITPPEKIDALKTSIKVFAKRPFATPKDASRITGRLISLLPAFDKITRLFTRHLYQFIDDHYLLYDQKSLNAEVKGELKIWLKNLRR